MHHIFRFAWDAKSTPLVTPTENRISFAVDLANAVPSNQTALQCAANAVLLINVPVFSIPRAISDGRNQISNATVKIIFVFSSKKL